MYENKLTRILTTKNERKKIMKKILLNGLRWLPVANEILLAIVLINEAAQRFIDWKKKKSETTTTPEDNDPEEVK